MYNDIRQGGHGYVAKLYGAGFVAPEFEDLEDFKAVHRAAISIIKREEERAKAPKRRKAATENEGYSEAVVEPVIEHWRFSPETRINSLIEDKWKADHYVNMCAKITRMLSRGESAIDSDLLEDVLVRAAEKFLRNESRPVLTNELSDFYNPFMMKKATSERLLHEACVRNKLEESLVKEVLNTDPQLIKLRSQADLPPEILEPLQAFRGVTDWSFDPEVRMTQKLVGVTRLIALIEEYGDEATKYFLKKEKKKIENSGFTSQVPAGRRGGWAHGKPVLADTVRYPTLQCVAHSLPKDAHYRAQAVHALRILERSRGWTFSDKTKAVNALKEVLDTQGFEDRKVHTSECTACAERLSRAIAT